MKSNHTAIVYTNNPMAEEPTSMVPSKIAEKKTKYLGINLTKVRKISMRKTTKHYDNK